MAAMFLLADVNNDPLRQPDIIWGTVALVTALLVGAAVIYVVDRWRKRNASTDADETGALTTYRAMYENGEITEAEYAELRRRVAEKVKKSPMPPVPGSPLPASQPGERVTTNPPTPPSSPPPPAPPSSSGGFTSGSV